MRNIKHMGLTNLMQPILGTKKIHTVEEDFSSKIMVKNTMQEEFSEKNKASLVLKHENSNEMEFFLETLLNLFAQLRSINAAGNISLTQNIVKQEVIKQIKNNISVSANTYHYSNLTQLFQSFSSQNSFNNAETIENVINVIESELKKNSKVKINLGEIKNTLNINETKKSASNTLWKKILKKNVSTFNALFKEKNAESFNTSRQFAQKNNSSFTSQRNEYNSSYWSESSNPLFKYSSYVFAHTLKERISPTIAKGSGETIREQWTVEGNSTFPITMSEQERVVPSKPSKDSILHKEGILYTKSNSYFTELNGKMHLQATSLRQSFYRNDIDNFTRSEIGNSFMNFIWNSNFKSTAYNSDIWLKQGNKTIIEAQNSRSYPARLEQALSYENYFNNTKLEQVLFYRNYFYNKESEQALFYGKSFHNDITHKKHQEVKGFWETRRVNNINPNLNWNLVKSSLQENFFKKNINLFQGNLFEDNNYLFNEISQIQQHEKNRDFKEKKEYYGNFEQNYYKSIRNERFHNQKQSIFKLQAENTVSNLFAAVLNYKNTHGINNYSGLNSWAFTNQSTYSYIKNIWKKQGNIPQYLLKKEKNRNNLTLFNFSGVKHIFQGHVLTYKQYGKLEKDNGDYGPRPFWLRNAMERDKLFIKNTAISSRLYDYSEKLFYNEWNVMEPTPMNIETTGESQISFKEHFYKGIEPNISVFKNKTFKQSYISFIQSFFKLEEIKKGGVLQQRTIDEGSEKQFITEITKNRNGFLGNYYRSNFYINKKLDSNLYHTQQKNDKDVYEEYNTENSNIQFLTQQDIHNKAEHNANKLSLHNSLSFSKKWTKKYESVVKQTAFLSNSFELTDIKKQKFELLLNVNKKDVNREEKREKRDFFFQQRFLQPMEYTTEGNSFVFYYGNIPLGREKLMGLYPLIYKKYHSWVSMGREKLKGVQHIILNEANYINQKTIDSLYLTNKNSLPISSEGTHSQDKFFHSFDTYYSLNRGKEPLKTKKGITQKKYYTITDHTETLTNRYLTQIYQKNRLFAISNEENKVLGKVENKNQRVGRENNIVNGLINRNTVENMAQAESSKGVDFISIRVLKTTSYTTLPEFGVSPIGVIHKEQPRDGTNTEYIEKEEKSNIIYRTKIEEVKTQQDIEEQIKKSVLLEVEEKVTKRLLSFQQQQVQEAEEKRKLDLLHQENIEKNEKILVSKETTDIDSIYEKVYEKMERALRSERRRIGR